MPDRSSNVLGVEFKGDVLSLYFKGIRVFRHSPSEPFVSAGIGRGIFEMFRGNFQVSEQLEELVALRKVELLDSQSDSVTLKFSRPLTYELVVRISVHQGRLIFSFSTPFKDLNRWRFSLAAEVEERVYGCGEQFSYLNLRGKKFPLWTSEQGVGRNKKTLVTWQADAAEGAGGDYFWTFFPQTSFVSSRRIWTYLETSAYSIFDFSEPHRHILYTWDLPSRMIMGFGSSMADTTADLYDFFGRQGELPDWCYDGIILGIQGGTEVCETKLKAAQEAGVPVAGIWAQDWEGIRITSFGQRLRWNWLWDTERYPQLDVKIPQWKRGGIRFLGYINPYVLRDHSLYQEALEKAFLALNTQGGPYLVDFGEFEAGIVDLTNPRAFSWYRGIIKQNLIDFGLSGWMADFGEYLPTDAVLYGGESAELLHNQWPALWARCNYEAIEEAGKQGDLLFFMRAGGPGSQRWCPLMWAGDQNVDWSEDDGLPSVIPAALSLALSGHGLHHSDIGGYTTLFGLKRTKELFMRWAEQAAFSPLMRTHEGNRPRDNWQFDGDRETLDHLARMTRIHVLLKDYLKAAVRENALHGKPVMAPLFLRFEDDPLAWDLKDQYLLGPDLLVAPVLREGATTRDLHLPRGTWIELWTGREWSVEDPRGLEISVAAPLGKPPVFYWAPSTWADFFSGAFHV